MLLDQAARIWKNRETGTERERFKFGVLLTKEGGFWVRSGGGARIVLFFIEGSSTIADVLAPHGVVTQVTNNHQQPSPPFPASDASEMSDSAQVGILHDVLRVVIILCKPLREIARGVWMAYEL
jgi:hypothetical protein